MTWPGGALRALWCWISYHSLYVDRGVACCLRCGRRWVGRSYE